MFIYVFIFDVAAIKSNIRVDCNINLADFIIYDREYDVLNKVEFHKITWNVEQDLIQDVEAAADIVKINFLLKKYIDDSIKSNKMSRISSDIKSTKVIPTRVNSATSTPSSSHIWNNDHSDVENFMKSAKKNKVIHPKKVIQTKQPKVKVSRIQFKNTINATGKKKRYVAKVIYYLFMNYIVTKFYCRIIQIMRVTLTILLHHRCCQQITMLITASVLNWNIHKG